MAMQKMTDLVERLRNCVAQDYDVSDDLVLDAAAEIERLTAEIARLERAYDQLREIYMNTVAR
jgi:hypothetical protein